METAQRTLEDRLAPTPPHTGASADSSNSAGTYNYGRRAAQEPQHRSRANFKPSASAEPAALAAATLAAALGRD